jgi:hypothetical protein
LIRSRFYERHRSVILFNKNILVAVFAALWAGASVAQIYSNIGASDLMSTTTALAVEYSVYISIFALLFYMTNKQRYVDPATGRRNTKLVWSDIKKLLAAFTVAEFVFSGTRIAVQYVLQSNAVEAYAASLAGSAVSWSVFFVMINVMARTVKLFKTEPNGT